MPLTTKKFLDADGLAYFAQLLDNYPNNEVLATVIDAIQDALDEQTAILNNLGGGLGLTVDEQGYICQTLEVEDNANNNSN